LFEKYVIFEKKIFNSAGQTELNFYGPNIILCLFYWLLFILFYFKFPTFRSCAFSLIFDKT
jgi:hypothetical protein